MHQVYMGYITMQGFFRTFGLMFSSFHTAFRVCAFFVPNMVMFVGYMIPVSDMKRWLFWIVRGNLRPYHEVVHLTNALL